MESNNAKLLSRQSFSTNRVQFPMGVITILIHVIHCQLEVHRPECQFVAVLTGKVLLYVGQRRKKLENTR